MFDWGQRLGIAGMSGEVVLASAAVKRTGQPKKNQKKPKTKNDNQNWNAALSCGTAGVWSSAASDGDAASARGVAWGWVGKPLHCHSIRQTLGAGATHWHGPAGGQAWGMMPSARARLNIHSADLAKSARWVALATAQRPDIP